MRTKNFDKIKAGVEFLEKNDDPDLIYGVQALAQTLNVHANTIFNWKRDGTIRGIKVGMKQGHVFRCGDVIQDLKKLCDNGKKK